jgi:hypothetical protein
MATTYKSFLANDVATTKQLLHEGIPLTGSLVSGTYGTLGAESNIKNFAHGMFQSVYDYPYLSSSSNHIFDITCGFAPDSALSQSAPTAAATLAVQQDKKIAIYNQMAQVLMGYDMTGSIQKFDADGNIYAGGAKINEAYFISFSRLLVKDEIKKGSFTLQLGSGATFAAANNSLLTIVDAGAQNDFRVNSPAGEYGILSASSGQGAGSTSGLCGLIFYQAGLVVLTASCFTAQPSGLLAANAVMTFTGQVGGGTSIIAPFTGSEISSSADWLRKRIYNCSFNNTTELNSTIYFVRANHNEFNYSSNPTYLSGSRIRVKNNTYDQPMTYITSVGLVSADNEILAQAKLSECVKKTPSSEVVFRVRLDY